MKYLEKLCKWRLVFASWQLGTRSKDDPECQAVRDHVDARLILRAEVSALTALLIKKGLISVEEFREQLETEAYLLDQMLEQKFPGWQSTEIGMAVVDVKKAIETMRGWKP